MISRVLIRAWVVPLCCGLSLAALAGPDSPEPAPPYEMTTYQFVMLLRGPNQRPMGEREIVRHQGAHLEYLKSLHEDGKAIIAGPLSRGGEIRGVVVLDAGSKSLSSDRGVGAAQVPGFGVVLGAPDQVLERLSEEHGMLRVPPDAAYRIGDRVRILPNHACVTTNLHDELVAVQGGKVEATWRVEARGCSL